MSLWWKPWINITSLTKRTSWKDISGSPREHASVVQLSRHPLLLWRITKQTESMQTHQNHWGTDLAFFYFLGRCCFGNTPRFQCQLLIYFVPVSLGLCLLWENLKSFCRKHLARETKKRLCFVFPGTRQKESHILYTHSHQSLATKRWGKGKYPLINTSAIHSFI